MTIEWNRVTWYSWAAALAVFLGTFAVAFALGTQYGRLYPLAASSTPAGPTTPSAGSTSTPSAGAPNIPVIDGSDQGKTIDLYVGEKFSLDFGTSMRWSFTFLPADSVVSLGDSLYEAEQAGTTTLRGTGAPICDPGEACPQYLVAFMATLAIH